jgi:preprotein translocase subunit SecG
MMFDQFVSFENIGVLADLNLGLLVMEILLFLSSLFLMLLILVQRGKGGGLTGALGGMGGQSAFGSKAGDAFTKITIITAVIWIMLCMLTIAAFNPPPAPAATVNNDAEISGSMGGDESETPPINEEGDSATTTEGEDADDTTTDGASDPDGTSVDEAVEVDLNESTENEGSTGTGESEKKPEGDGN